MFVGVFRTAPDPGGAPADLARRWRTAINPFDQADEHGAWIGDRAVVVATVTWNTSESRLEQVPYRCPTTGRVLAAWARLDNRESLARALGLDRGRLGSLTDPALILATFDRWGSGCTDHLLGAFCFVIYDPADGSIFAARDHLGVRPLYYHASPGLFAVASTAAVFAEIPGLHLTPSSEWMAKYVTQSSMSHTATAWPQVKKLPGGHQLSLADRQLATGRVEPVSYFSFRDDPPDARRRSPEWVDNYRAVLEESVRCRLQTDFPLGVETSGGIDSSTCLGYAAKLWERPLDQLHAFGFIHCQDEPAYIYETSRMHGITNDHIYADVDRDGRDETLERTLQVLGYPEEHGNGSGHEPFYRECEELGVRTLLSGFGGDEAVTNPAHLLYRELIARRRYLALVRHMHGSAAARPARAAREIVRSRRSRPSHLRELSWRRWENHPFRASAVEGFDLSAGYEARHRYDEGYDTINGWVLGERLGNSFVPTRLENCSLMAQARRVDYRWPLLDVRLIQQYLSTPAIEKRGAGVGRYLHRRAIEGVVPPKVQWKPSKYMGEPLRQRGRSSIVAAAGRVFADLHPALDELIDRDKVKRLARALDARVADGKSDVAFTLSRTVSSIGVLNTWLLRSHR